MNGIDHDPCQCISTNLEEKKEFDPLKISLYELIVQQLIADGFSHVAKKLKSALQFPSDWPLDNAETNYEFGNKLFHLYCNACSILQKDSLCRSNDNPAQILNESLIKMEGSGCMEGGNAVPKYLYKRSDWIPISPNKIRASSNFPSLHFNLTTTSEQHTLEDNISSSSATPKTTITDIPTVVTTSSPIFSLNPGGGGGETTSGLLEGNIGPVIIGPSHTSSLAPLPPLRHPTETWSAAHKDICTVVALSPNDNIAASGGQDNAVRVMVQREVTASPTTSTLMGNTPMFSDNQGSHSVDSVSTPESRVWTRVFQEHTDAVTAVELRSNIPLLFSGSRDCTVKLYEISKLKYRRASYTFKDSAPITKLVLHPCGTILYCGTTHPIIRCYDIERSECFSAQRAQDHHQNGILSMCCSDDGTILVSGSADGNIKIWNAVSMKVINTITHAHNKLPVTSLDLSMNQRYLLSSGNDGMIRIWDCRTGRELQHMSPLHDRSPFATTHSVGIKAVFMADNRYIASIAQNPVSDVVFYDAQSGHFINELHAHARGVTDIQASRNSLSLLTAGTDFKCRFLDFGNVQKDNAQLS